MKVAEKNGPGYADDPVGGIGSTSKDPMYQKRASLDETDPIVRGNNNAAPPQVKPMGKVHG
jgi:hypothetical protein